MDAEAFPFADGEAQSVEVLVVEVLAEEAGELLAAKLPRPVARVGEWLGREADLLLGAVVDREAPIGVCISYISTFII